MCVVTTLDGTPLDRTQPPGPVVERSTPPPRHLRRLVLPSPVPTRTAPDDGSTASAPTDKVGKLSLTGVQWPPPSGVRHTPPAAAPAYTVLPLLSRVSIASDVTRPSTVVQPSCEGSYCGSVTCSGCGPTLVHALLALEMAAAGAACIAR